MNLIIPIHKLINSDQEVLMKLSSIVAFQFAFISLATSSVAHLLLRIIIGKELGALGLGSYTLLFIIYMLGLQFSSFGVGFALTKYVPEAINDDFKLKTLISSGLFISGISGILMCIAIYLLSSMIAIDLFHNPALIYPIKIISICYPFLAIEKCVLGILNGLGRMKHYAFVNLIQNILIFTITGWLVIFWKLGIFGASVAFIASSIITGCIALLFIKDFVQLSDNIVIYVNELIRFGFYVMLSNSMLLINTQIDSLLQGYFLNSEEVGYYAVAVLFVQGIALIPTSIQLINSPSIARHYYNNNINYLKILIKKSMLVSFIIALLITIVFFIFGKSLIILLFNSDFLKSYEPLIILSLGYTIYSPFIAVGSTLSMIGKVNVAFRVEAICAVINILLNCILIQAYGIIGSAFAVSSALLVNCIIILLLLKKYVFDLHYD